MFSINKILGAVSSENGWVVTDTITQAEFRSQSCDLAVKYALHEVQLARCRRKLLPAPVRFGGRGVRRKGITDRRVFSLPKRRGDRRLL